MPAQTLPSHLIVPHYPPVAGGQSKAADPTKVSQLARHHTHSDIGTHALCVDSRNLSQWPTIAQAATLQLLSARNNLLSSLPEAPHLPSLALLDLHNNLLVTVSAVRHLVGLRVLILSRNRIRRLHGIECLARLEVLDLSHNFVARLHGFRALGRLRVLDISDNVLTSTRGIAGAVALQLLSVKQNRLHALAELERLQQLTSLDARHNQLAEPTSLSALLHCVRLKKLFLSGNAVVSHPRVKQFLLQLPCLLHLDPEACEAPREVAPEGVKRRHVSLRGTRHTECAAIGRSHTETGRQTISRPLRHSASLQTVATKAPVALRQRQLPRPQDKHHPAPLIDHSTLTAVCENVDFGVSAVPQLLSTRSATLTHLYVDNASLDSVSQLNIVAHLTQLTCLAVTARGNAVSAWQLWPLYAVFRASERLARVNSRCVGGVERARAGRVFGDLAKIDGRESRYAHAQNEVRRRRFMQHVHAMSRLCETVGRLRATVSVERLVRRAGGQRGEGVRGWMVTPAAWRPDVVEMSRSLAQRIRAQQCLHEIEDEFRRADRSAVSSRPSA